LANREVIDRKVRECQEITQHRARTRTPLSIKARPRCRHASQVIRAYDLASESFRGGADTTTSQAGCEQPARSRNGLEHCSIIDRLLINVRTTGGRPRFGTFPRRTVIEALHRYPFVGFLSAI
jgi:hypothetical protein